MFRTRLRVQRVLLAATTRMAQWQCSQCSAWFESDTPSQTCPGCS
ncbi:hypothetical protein OG896_24710 [Streptomyces sp. NBC_00669]|nr:hypothetical protein [Streptomyces sp. NBC_00669]